MDEREWLAQRFEEHRAHLRAAAYRMLGSAGEADDAVQEAWLHVDRAGAGGVRNLGAWLTTIVARVCLDMLRSRQARREEPLGERVPEPVATGADPEHEATLAESVGLALLVVLETLTPAERVAFVLHDTFGVPFDEIAQVLHRSPQATRQLASRARRRVRATGSLPDADLDRQRDVVKAFLAASRGGDFEALLELLAPDVTVRADARAVPPGAPTKFTGARRVARQALTFSRRSRHAEPALVDGSPGIVVAPGGRLAVAMVFGFRGSQVAGIDVVADPARLRTVSVAVLR